MCICDQHFWSNSIPVIRLCVTSPMLSITFWSSRVWSSLLTWKPHFHVSRDDQWGCQYPLTDPDSSSSSSVFKSRYEEILFQFTLAEKINFLMFWAIPSSHLISCWPSFMIKDLLSVDSYRKSCKVTCTLQGKVHILCPKNSYLKLKFTFQTPLSSLFCEGLKNHNISYLRAIISFLFQNYIK